MSFKIEDDIVFRKYNRIWNRINKTLDIKFRSKSFYDEKYIKAKVKAVNDVVNNDME